MATGVYNLKTLNDNWFEDRCQPPGSLSATAAGNKINRPYETDLAYIGERYDVLSRIARFPTRASYALPEDGFNEKEKTSLVDFADPRSRNDWGKGKAIAPTMITTENAPVDPNKEKRELPGTRSGFGAHIHRHDEGHDRRWFNTTSGDFYGEGSRQKMERPCASTLHPAGLDTEHEEARVQGVKVGVLWGEA